MRETARDLEAYGEQYGSLPFEPVQARYRRRRVLERVAAHGPRRVAEIGCGTAPLFVDLPDLEHVVVEPTPEFAENARRLAADRPGVTVVEDYAERVDPADVGGTVDLVVVSGLLHEVPEPQRVLAAARRLCGPAAVVHVSVPSARSLHRLLAVAMGLIPDPATISDKQRSLQQQRTYDAPALDRELAEAGFTVRDRGSILVKPFTHAQMQELLDAGFMTASLLDGLDRLADLLPDLGSEIWVDAEPTGD